MTPLSAPKVVVVMPAYNAGRTLRMTYEALPKDTVSTVILVDDGLPIAGNGDMSEFLFGVPTSEIWRLSLGLGYRLSPNLIFKGEYSFERGKQVNGDHRDHEDLFALEAAFRF